MAWCGFQIRLSLRSIPYPLSPALPCYAGESVPVLALPPVPASVISLFEVEYRELRPRAPMPPMDIRFRRFTSLNTTIRLREGRLHIRLSDLLEHAPDSVHQAIAHILLAKLYRN